MTESRWETLFRDMTYPGGVVLDRAKLTEARLRAPTTIEEVIDDALAKLDAAGVDTLDMRPDDETNVR